MKVIVLLLVAVALFSTGAESQRSQYYDPDPDQDSEGDFADEVPIAPFLRDFLKPFPLLLPPPRPPPNPEFDNLRHTNSLLEKILNCMIQMVDKMDANPKSVNTTGATPINPDDKANSTIINVPVVSSGSSNSNTSMKADVGPAPGSVPETASIVKPTGTGGTNDTKPGQA